jgi:hypothetical protein
MRMMRGMVEEDIQKSAVSVGIAETEGRESEKKERLLSREMVPLESMISRYGKLEFWLQPAIKAAIMPIQTKVNILKVIVKSYSSFRIFFFFFLWLCNILCVKLTSIEGYDVAIKQGFIKLFP